MSDTQNAVATPAPAMIGKIAPANMKPKRLLGQPEGVAELYLGTLVGISDKFVTRKAPDETVFVGYGGTFEYIDHAPDVGVLQSGVLFMPSGIDDAMKAACEAAFAENGGQVRLAFEVYVFRSTAPVGYSWKFVPLHEPAKADPLADLKAMVADKSRHLLSSNSVKALADKTIEGDAAKTEAPKEKAKA